MKFLITMNMPSQSGKEIHNMIVEHPAGSIKELVEELEENDFLVVEEYYIDNTDKKKPPEYRGQVGINYRYVGKVKEYKER